MQGQRAEVRIRAARRAGDGPWASQGAATAHGGGSRDSEEEVRGGGQRGREDEGCRTTTLLTS